MPQTIKRRQPPVIRHVATHRAKMVPPCRHTARMMVKHKQQNQ